MVTKTSSFNNLGGKTCFGRITSVNSTARTVSCKTIGLVGATDDQYLHNVKILHLAWHPEGDEETYIPRIGAYGVILFINSEPYIVGYYPLSNSEGEDQRSNFEALQPGDKVIKTVGGNKITLRSGGVVQVESTLGCRTYWIPSQELINTVCRNLEIEPAGGYMHWKLDPDTNDTLMKFVAYNNLEVSTVIQAEIGAASDGESVVDFAVGDPDEDLAIAERRMQMQVKPDGTTHFEIGPTNLTLDIDPDGTTSLNVGPDKMTLDIAADGTTEINIGVGKILLTMNPDGTLELTTEDSITVTCKKDLTATISGKCNIHTDGDTTIDAGGKVTVNAGGDAAIKASGNATVDASAINLNGKAGQILTTATDPIVDAITGIPTVGVPTVSAG
jgi:phage gp45-like